MIFWLVLTVLLAMTALAAYSLWRAWRDPQNWKLEPTTGQLAFNHWKEIALSALVFLAALAMTALWVV